MLFIHCIQPICSYCKINSKMIRINKFQLESTASQGTYIHRTGIWLYFRWMREWNVAIATKTTISSAANAFDIDFNVIILKYHSFRNVYLIPQRLFTFPGNCWKIAERKKHIEITIGCAVFVWLQQNATVLASYASHMWHISCQKIIVVYSKVIHIFSTSYIQRVR